MNNFVRDYEDKEKVSLIKVYSNMNLSLYEMKGISGKDLKLPKPSQFIVGNN